MCVVFSHFDHDEFQTSEPLRIWLAASVSMASADKKCEAPPTDLLTTRSQLETKQPGR